MKTVIALFDTAADAKYAVDALLLRKYDHSDISVVANDLATLHEAPPHAGQIAAGALSTVLGLAAFGVPYAGPVLAAGPILGALGSVGAEDVDKSDWLAPALVKMGIPQGEASKFSEAFNRGGAVVTVRTREIDAPNIASLLAACGAVDVDERVRPETRRRSTG
ncbi:hypothetical protein [Nannocystis bainbridge]|uniref:DUF1269 domain-containing protein n=1 Tax=Nannocystis bainbridge TaxID=2995303 RepID=A0ABT5E9S0_9BACT|nr:hypothetical protein [Nannocystis bainbridge]MDC0721516.1 hypothetical protein [Nannocystis bainbridge]